MEVEERQEDPKQISESLTTPELLEEFKKIYREQFGVKFSDDDAFDKALNLLNLFEAIYRPIPVEPKTPPSAPRSRPSPEAHNDGRQLRLF